MARCEMCGFDAPTRPDGRCFLGHRLGAEPLASESPPRAAEPEPDSPQASDSPAPVETTVAVDASPLESIPPEAMEALFYAAPFMDRAGEDDSPALVPFEVDAHSHVDESPVFAGGDEPAATPAEPPFESPAPDPSLRPVAQGATTNERLELFAATTAKGMPRQLVAGALAVVLVAAGALGYFVFGPASGSAEAAMYRRMFTKGDSHRYRMDMTMRGTVSAGGQEQPMNLSMGLLMSEQTLSVAASGVATVRYGIDDITMSANGESVPIPIQKSLAVTLKIAPDGKVLSVEGANGLGFSDLGPAGSLFGPESFGPLLPDHAVAPGDTWTVTTKQDIPFLDEPLSVTARNKLLRLSDERGVELAVIQSKIEMPLDMRVSLADLASQLGGATGGFPGMPADASFSYSGGMQMSLVQTVERETSRPLSVSGDGSMKMKMKIHGAPVPIPEVEMDIDLTVSFSEIGAV